MRLRRQLGQTVIFSTPNMMRFPQCGQRQYFTMTYITAAKIVTLNKIEFYIHVRLFLIQLVKFLV